MSKSKKFVALFLAFALVLSMFALGGCTEDTEEGAETEETTEEGTAAAEEFILVEAVSYTHLTLPTNREV